MDNYDVIVIGAGPGGYVAAIRCAQLGLKTACVESWINHEKKPVLGGTCLNVGCIPSKALLDSSHRYYQLKHEFAEHGINVSGATIDLQKMQARKEKIVHILTKGIASLFKKNAIDWLQGYGKLHNDRQVEICQADEQHLENKIVTAKHIIIATGSVPVKVPWAVVDHQKIMDSSSALSLCEVPRNLVIIGAGAIGLELGSVWNRLGSKVILLEAADEFLPSVDRQISEEAKKMFEKQGLDIRLGVKVMGTSANQHQVSISYEDERGKKNLLADKLVVAVGRKPNTNYLGVEKIDLAVDRHGFIKVDEKWQTNLPGVYAIGDVVGGPMLAHKASEEGMAVAEQITGHFGQVNYNNIPWVIYTWPEIAWVGQTEQKLKAADCDFHVGTFPFMASGRARAMGETNGIVKILADAKTDQILGVHILGPHASELICEAVVAMSFEGCAEDLARVIHAHPTLSEAMHEAALSVDQRGLHI